MPCLQVSSEHGPNSTAFRAGAQRHPSDWVASGGLHLLGWRPPTTTSVVLRLAAVRPPRRSPPGPQPASLRPTTPPSTWSPCHCRVHRSGSATAVCVRKTLDIQNNPDVTARCLQTPRKHGPSKPHTPLALRSIESAEHLAWLRIVGLTEGSVSRRHDRPFTVHNRKRPIASGATDGAGHTFSFRSENWPPRIRSPQLASSRISSLDS